MGAAGDEKVLGKVIRRHGGVVLQVDGTAERFRYSQQAAKVLSKGGYGPILPDAILQRPGVCVVR